MSDIPDGTPVVCQWCHKTLEEHRVDGPDARMPCLGKRSGFLAMLAVSPVDSPPHRGRAEMRERHRVASELDKALLRLDLDGLRFVLCVAIVRGLPPEELGKLADHLKVSAPKKTGVQP